MPTSHNLSCLNSNVFWFLQIYNLFFLFSCTFSLTLPSLLYLRTSLLILWFQILLRRYIFSWSTGQLTSKILLNSLLIDFLLNLVISAINKILQITIPFPINSGVSVSCSVELLWLRKYRCYVNCNISYQNITVSRVPDTSTQKKKHLIFEGEKYYVQLYNSLLFWY